MKRCIAAIIVIVGALAALAVPASARPIDPIDPDPPPPTTSGPSYAQRWASVTANPDFQAMMAAAGQAEDRTTMEGLRSLVAGELPMPANPGGSANSASPGEVEAARQQVLDLLVMPGSEAAARSIPEAEAQAAAGAAAAGAPAGAQDPLFCDPQRFRAAALPPDLPGPYGEFAANPANNFCMPNGPYEANLCTFAPDRSFFFDFRRACYQHDLAYTWKVLPAEQRGLIDLQFLLDMTTDCTRAHPWYSLRRYGCYATAGIYYVAVRLFAGGRYREPFEILGFTRPRLPGEALPVFPPFVLPGRNSTCRQSSHAWVGELGSTVTRGTTVYPTGVVAAATRVVFDFADPVTGQIVARHVTQPSRLNCVVHHEPEAFSTWNLPPGRIDVYATYTRWEAQENVRVLVGSTTAVDGSSGGGGGGSGGGGGGCLLGPCDVIFAS